MLWCLLIWVWVYRVGSHWNYTHTQARALHVRIRGLWGRLLLTVWTWNMSFTKISNHPLFLSAAHALPRGRPTLAACTVVGGLSPDHISYKCFWCRRNVITIYYTIIRIVKLVTIFVCSLNPKNVFQLVYRLGTRGRFENSILRNLRTLYIQYGRRSRYCIYILL